MAQIARRNVGVSLALATGFLITCTPAVAASTPHRPASVSAKNLVLTANDVQQVYGSGFKREIAKSMTRKDATSVISETGQQGYAPLLKGWSSGYTDLFVRRSPLAQAGSVQSSVSMYASTGTAKRIVQYTWSNRAAILKHLAKSGIQEKMTTLGGIGEFAVLGTFTSKGLSVGGTTVGKSSGATLYFSRGRYEATVSVGFRTVVKTAQVVALARAIDRRMQHAST